MNKAGDITLTVTRPGEAERVVRLDKSTVVIGRAPTCDLAIDEDGIGKEHARLEFTPEGGLRLVDLGTSLGCTLNGNRVGGTTLVSSGDAMSIGGTMIKVVFRTVTASARPNPWAKYENPKRPVINVAQVWGDSVLSVQRFGAHYRQKAHALVFTAILLGIQAWVLVGFYSGYHQAYQDGALDMNAYARAIREGVLYMGLFFALADIFVFTMVRELFVPSRHEQGANIIVGFGPKADFFLPEDAIDQEHYQLMTRRGGRPFLNLSSEKVDGIVLVKGQNISIGELRKTSLLVQGRYLPLELGTKAKICLGDFTLILSMDPSMQEPKGRTLSQISSTSVAYFALAFFLHALFMLAVMITPSGDNMDIYTKEVPSALQMVIQVQKRELALQREQEEEKKELEKDKEKKADKDERKPEEVPEVQQAKTEKTEVQEVKKAQAVVLKKADDGDKGLKRTLEVQSNKQKRTLTSTVVSKAAVRDKGALGALSSLRAGALGSEFGVEMNVGMPKLLGEAALDDLGDDVYANLGGGGSDADPFAIAGGGGGGGGIGGGNGSDGREGMQGFDATIGADGLAVGSGEPGKGGPIVLGGMGGIAELDKNTLAKNTKAAQFREKQVKILPKDIQMEGGGKLDKETVKSHIRKQLGGIRWCYQKGYQKNPNLEGKVTVRFIIATAGKVIKAEIMKSTLGDAEVEACIEQKILSWRFPEPKGGIVKVVYPFVLRRQ
jgi:outer membrane biosynthesis protein TonB/pSer/pThr/pTyr-binding forkhead associated (FHA) protein